MLYIPRRAGKGVKVSPASSPFHPPSAPLWGLCRRVPAKGPDPFIGAGAPMSRSYDLLVDRRSGDSQDGLDRPGMASTQHPARSRVKAGRRPPRKRREAALRRRGGVLFDQSRSICFFGMPARVGIWINPRRMASASRIWTPVFANSMPTWSPAWPRVDNSDLVAVRAARS